MMPHPAVAPLQDDRGEMLRIAWRDRTDPGGT
jgi:hypothetical protein